MRVTCFVQKKLQCPRSGGESSNHKAAIPLILHVGLMHYCLHMTGSGKVVTFDVSLLAYQVIIRC